MVFPEFLKCIMQIAKKLCFSEMTKNVSVILGSFIKNSCFSSCTSLDAAIYQNLLAGLQAKSVNALSLSPRFVCSSICLYLFKYSCTVPAHDYYIRLKIILIDCTVYSKLEYLEVVITVHLII